MAASRLRTLPALAELAARVPAEWATPFLPLRALERLQARRVREAVGHAQQHVPFYREEMRRRGLTAADFATAGDLRKLPIVERDDLQADPERFASRARPLTDYVVMRSGGSSGRPVTVFYDPQRVLADAARNERRTFVASRLAGRPRLRVAEILLPPDEGHPLIAPVFRERLPSAREVRTPMLRLSLHDPPAAQLDRLNAFRPHVISTYGSYLEELFAHVWTTGASFAAPRVVVVRSDPLPAGARRLIAGRFGAAILSWYNATEVGPIGFSCEHGSPAHHLNVDHCPVRIVDDAGRDVPHGTEGSVVASNLVSRGTVLFNYRVGDVAAIDPARCRCGRTLPVLRPLAGRAGMWLTGSDGERIHEKVVETLVSHDPDVLGYQVVQRAHGYEALIVPAPGADRAALAARVRERFDDRLAPAARTAVTFVSRLPRTPGGKVLRVVPLER